MVLDRGLIELKNTNKVPGLIDFTCLVWRWGDEGLGTAYNKLVTKYTNKVISDSDKFYERTKQVLQWERMSVLSISESNYLLAE